MKVREKKSVVLKKTDSQYEMAKIYIIYYMYIYTIYNLHINYNQLLYYI